MKGIKELTKDIAQLDDLAVDLANSAVEFAGDAMDAIGDVAGDVIPLIPELAGTFAGGAAAAFMPMDDMGGMDASLGNQMGAYPTAYPQYASVPQYTTTGTVVPGGTQVFSPGNGIKVAISLG